MTEIEAGVVALCRAARQAARTLATASTDARNTALRAAAARLRDEAAALVAANRGDVEAGRAAGLSAALVDRLTVTPARVEAMAQGLDEIAALPDPLGETISRWRRPNGLDIAQVRIPIGVVGMIYESRPNVTADAASG
jgi:glutamate-5-semialdehyde dehydrogenase